MAMLALAAIAFVGIVHAAGEGIFLGINDCFALAG